MDRIDEKLLGLLTENGRASIKELAGTIGLSRTATTERLRRLENTGQIEAYTIRQRSVENCYEALLMITTHQPSCDSLAPRLQAISEVCSMYSLSGDIDVQIHLRTRTTQKLHQIREIIASWPEIASVSTSSILKTHIDR